MLWGIISLHLCFYVSCFICTCWFEYKSRCIKFCKYQNIKHTNKMQCHEHMRGNNLRSWYCGYRPPLCYTVCKHICNKSRPAYITNIRNGSTARKQFADNNLWYTKGFLVGTYINIDHWRIFIQSSNIVCICDVNCRYTSLIK